MTTHTPTDSPATTTSGDTISPPTVQIGEWRYVRWDQHEAATDTIRELRTERDSLKVNLEDTRRAMHAERKSAESHDESRQQLLIEKLREYGMDNDGLQQLLSELDLPPLKVEYRTTLRVLVPLEIEIDVMATDRNEIMNELGEDPSYAEEIRLAACAMLKTNDTSVVEVDYSTMELVDSSELG